CGFILGTGPAAPFAFAIEFTHILHKKPFKGYQSLLSASLPSRRSKPEVNHVVGKFYIDVNAISDWGA
ncbi:MAG TPA: hypothetical protein VL945_02365, partial [Candidatus Saccharimonadales bacterium]|nr:hypothetical protein [Candidatus Saccharimonadales bacterium]